MSAWTAADLAAWRKRLGLSQARAGEELRIAGRTVQQYELGRRPIPAWLPVLAGYIERERLNGLGGATALGEMTKERGA